MKKLLTIWLLVMLMNVGVADASSIKGSKVSAISCVRDGVEGAIGFEDFLNGMMFAQGFKDELIEPWRDAIFTTQCHAADLFSLAKQEDAIRKQIRSAFLTCNVDKLPDFTRAYEKVVVEIYYVRHVVQRKATFSLPGGFVSTHPDILDTPRQELYSDMYSRFVTKGKYFNKNTNNEFTNFFTGLEQKYGERKETYKICPNTSWEDVLLKWEDFKEELIDGFGIADALKESQKRAEHIKDEAMFYKTLTTREGFKNWVSSLVEINVNNLEPKEGFDAIWERLESYYPSGVSQDTFVKNLSEADRQYDTQVSKIDLASRFHAKYVNSDVSVQAFLDELEALDKAITDSYGPIDGVKQCTATMNDRQCPGQ